MPTVTEKADPKNVHKLNVGCRRTRIPGFHNLDIRQDQDVDFIGNAADLWMFETGQLDELYASNILEHFNLNDTVDVLKDWCRVLKPGGKLWVSVPDFDFCVRLYQKEGTISDWLVYHMMGEQRHPQQFHYNLFDWPRLRAMLHEAGFSKAKRLDELPYGLQDASALRENHYGMSISLNIEATK